jgi:hypothetical protein
MKKRKCLVELGFKLRTLCLQSRCLTTWANLLPILLWLFWRWGLMNYLPRLALNYDAPNLSLPNS